MIGNKTMNKLLNKDILVACKVASTSTIKPALACVKITPKKIIATDSFRAIIIDRKDDMDAKAFPEGEKANLSEEGVLIYAKQLSKKLKLRKNKHLKSISETALLIEKEKTVDIRTTDLETTDTIAFNKVDEEYPDVEMLIPNTLPLAVGSFDVNFLIGLLECFKDKTMEPVEIQMREDNKVLVIKKGNKIGLIMPRNKK